ncbi:hypothetical protein B0H10DRAFT_13255 [Mycena sp. CBHHK59/15]|nr:hypothetical protein B0H10DRAFT_13255 [Mycena sp. CBHHK59/15]
MGEAHGHYTGRAPGGDQRRTPCLTPSQDVSSHPAKLVAVQTGRGSALRQEPTALQPSSLHLPNSASTAVPVKFLRHVLAAAAPNPAAVDGCHVALALCSR